MPGHPATAALADALSKGHALTPAQQDQGVTPGIAVGKVVSLDLDSGTAVITLNDTAPHAPAWLLGNAAMDPTLQVGSDVEVLVIGTHNYIVASRGVAIPGGYMVGAPYGVAWGSVSVPNDALDHVLNISSGGNTLLYGMTVVGDTLVAPLDGVYDIWWLIANVAPGGGFGFQSGVQVNGTVWGAIANAVTGGASIPLLAGDAMAIVGLNATGSSVTANSTLTAAWRAQR